MNIIEPGRIFDFTALVLIMFFVYLWIYLSEKGKATVEIRKLVAMDHIDESIGSAAEKGRRALFLARGRLTSGSNAPQMIATLSILPMVAQKCAEIGVPLTTAYDDPNLGPLIIENMKEGFTMAGKHEHMKPDSVKFFPYMSHTMGILGEITEKGNEPGSIVYLGAMLHEAIIWGEAGRRVGAMCIGGTAAQSQLPFLIATMDYVLLGEELFAAGAYVSKNPIIVGSIRGQDWGKFMTIIVVLIACLSASIGLTAVKTIMGL